MGRYCFFNTGFEYKFLFAIQSSYDITMFGGSGHATGERPYQEWTRKDIPFITVMLSALERNLQISVPFQANTFDSSLKGTWDCSQILRERIKDKDPQLYAQYMLGCLILHQLLYTPELIALYEP